MSTLVGSNFSDRFTIANSDDIDLSIIGNRDEDASNGTATNTLVGADRENHWSITSAGGGMLNGRIQFQDIDSLVGGTNLDQFVLSGWGSVSQIDGGELEIGRASCRERVWASEGTVCGEREEACVILAWVVT